MRDVRGVDHALGYAALVDGSIDVKDAYSTDAKIAENDLVVLEDDLGFFPRYAAVFLYRMDMNARVVDALQKLAGTIDERRMIALNAEAERTKDYSQAAAMYFDERATGPRRGMLRNIAHWTGRHLTLVGISLLLAVIAGVPLGIVASRPGTLGHLILGTAGIIQTVPALALLALLVPVPWLGISATTAILALFLYSLLPIIRNTAAGLQNIPVPLRESAAALGLEPFARLRKIYLPIASRTILAGIKTSAVINVGSATLAALIGAGGLGEPIISGLNLNDHATILQGAVPAALLAVCVQGIFELLDRLCIPRGLRLPQS
jgi:osmoprotectant transport system permease protein